MKFKTVLLALLADEKFSIPGLAESVGVSPKSVYDWVNGKFEPSKKHYAKIAEYFQTTEADLLARVFTPNPEAGWLKLPILGEIPAGNPVEAIELVIRYFSIPDELKSQMDFGLIVKGDSMIGAGINDGDVVFVKYQPVAEHRQIIVARLDGAATIKRFFRTDHSVILKPENNSFESILVDSTREFSIVGVVMGLWRWGVK